MSRVPPAVRIKERLFANPPRNGAFYTLAVDGRGGSGKSELASHLGQRFPGLVVINGDDYFEPVDDEITWGAFNEERFYRDVVQPLKLGRRFVYRPYDSHAEPHITAREIFVVEGLLLERCFSFALDLKWDLKLWVETPPALCLERGLKRDLMRRERVMAVWRDVWQPREDEYIRRVRPLERADFVIDGTRPFAQQIV